MSYVNTGYQRATTLTVQTKVNGAVTATNVLPLMQSFTYNGTTYPAVDATQIAQMSTADYNARVTAYASYVQLNYQTQYPGLQVTSVGARVYNTAACPI